jgi:hypothetical protein
LAFGVLVEFPVVNDYSQGSIFLQHYQ